MHIIINCLKEWLRCRVYDNVAVQFEFTKMETPLFSDLLEVTSFKWSVDKLLKCFPSSRCEISLERRCRLLNYH